MKLDLLFHKTLYYNLLCFITMSGCQHSCISQRWPGVQFPHGPTIHFLNLILLGSPNLLQESPLLQMQRWESHKSYKEASIKAYLLLQCLNNILGENKKNLPLKMVHFTKISITDLWMPVSYFVSVLAKIFCCIWWPNKGCKSYKKRVFDPIYVKVDKFAA